MDQYAYCWGRTVFCAGTAIRRLADLQIDAAGSLADIARHKEQKRGLIDIRSTGRGRETAQSAKTTHAPDHQKHH